MCGLRWLSHLALSRYKSFHMCCFFGCADSFLHPVLILLQRTVPRLSKVLAVGSRRLGLLKSSAAPAAPAGSGSPFSAHPGHKHRRLPPGAADQHAQVQIRVVAVYTQLKKKKERNLIFFSFVCMLSLSSQGEECPPPPPVSWGHVTGLQPSLLGHLKGFVKNLDNPLERETCLLVIPAYLVYLHAYYHQLFRQVPVSSGCTVKLEKSC